MKHPFGVTESFPSRDTPEMFRWPGCLVWLIHIAILVWFTMPLWLK